MEVSTVLQAIDELSAMIRRAEAEKTALRREVEIAKAGEDLVLDTLECRDKEIVGLRAKLDATQNHAGLSARSLHAALHDKAALQAIIDLLPADTLAVIIDHCKYAYSCMPYGASVLQDFADAVAAREGAEMPEELEPIEDTKAAFHKLQMQTCKEAQNDD